MTYSWVVDHLILNSIFNSLFTSFGEKALVMKQFLSDEKVQEIGEIIEMKITHRKNIERRKAKFG
jgi:hypothetical protein